MSGPAQPVTSILDTDDTPGTSSPQYRDQSYQGTPHPADSHLQSQSQNFNQSGMSSSTYAQFQAQTPPAQNGEPYAPKVVDPPRDKYSQPISQANEATAEYSQPQIHSSELHEKDALSPNTGAPTPTSPAGAGSMIMNGTSGGNSDSAREHANAIVLGTLQQANTMASNAAEKVNAVVYETTQTAKVKILASPAMQETTKQLKENFAPDSHELAREDYGIQGAVQNHAGASVGEVKDIGWHRPTIEIPDPLIGGLPNGRLFSMIRRFNKDVFDVRAVPLEATRGLDLNEAWSDEHASDKMKLHLQRLYLSVVLGMVSLGKQISRLRSWKETRRTSAFCVAYIAAWTFDLLMPLVLGTLIAVVSSDELRDTLFPAAPLALVNISTGGIQKPQAGQLGTSNTLTGAPEKEEGEAVEEEAANFVDNIRHLVGRAIGMHEKDQMGGKPLEGKIPKPVRNIAKNIKSAGSAPGHSSGLTDQTQKPMEEILWDKANPEQIEPIIKAAPHAVGEVVDNWERLANAISPTPPFNKLSFLRIDAILVPAFLASLFVKYYILYKGIGFAIGFGLFGDPILTPSVKWLNKHYPKWLELLEPKNNILRGVPTNSQLTLTLLRIGEANKTPIPPAPSTRPEDPDQKQTFNPDDGFLGATDAEIANAVEGGASVEKSYPEHQQEEEPPKHKRLSKFMRFFKGNTKAVVETKLAVDHVRAKAGSEKAKGHVGVLPKKKNLVYAGPSEYIARYEGKKGWVYITESSVLFNTKDQGDKSGPVFELPIKHIKQLKRATAFTYKAAEIAADWDTEKDLLGSVEIDDQNDKTYRLTALPERDELFNRLVAIGKHRWENV